MKPNNMELDAGEELWTEERFEEAQEILERHYRMALLSIMSDAAAAMQFLEHGQFDLAMTKISTIQTVSECFGDRKGGSNGRGSSNSKG